MRSARQEGVGTRLAKGYFMQNYFLAGNDLVCWDLQFIPANNQPHVRLTVKHGQGAIVEYFKSADAALRRERELEDLIIAARSFGATRPALAIAL